LDSHYDIYNQNRGRMSLTLSVSIYLYFAVLVNPHNIRDLLHMGGRRGVDHSFAFHFSFREYQLTSAIYLLD
jgi:hypothetical protein